MSEMIVNYLYTLFNNITLYTKSAFQQTHGNCIKYLIIHYDLICVLQDQITNAVLSQPEIIGDLCGNNMI